MQSFDGDDFSLCDNIFLIKEKFSDGGNCYINFGMNYYIIFFPDGWNKKKNMVIFGPGT
jgi:hypothetical protein